MYSWRCSARRFGALLALCAAIRCSGQTLRFATPQTYIAQNGPAAVTSADFNGDGHPDLAVANIGSGSISVFLGKGDGTFGPPTNPAIPGGCTANYLAVGAFTRGSHGTDVLAVCGFENRLAVLPSTGNGAFAAPVVTTLPQAAIVGMAGELSAAPSVADFNGDGLLDIALVISDDITTKATLAVFLNHGDGTFAGAPPVPPAAGIPCIPAAGDFNGDGLVDLAYLSTMPASGSSLVILLGDGHGSFQVHATYPATVFGLYGSLVAADFNGDGITDLVAAGVSTGSVNTPTSTVVGYRGKGDGTFQQTSTQDFQDVLAYVTAADLHGSGALDLVGTAINSSTQGYGVVFPGHGDGSFATPVSLPLNGLDAFPFQPAAADLNGDGRVDLVYPILSLNQLAVNANGSVPNSASVAAILAELTGGSAAVLLNTTPAVPVISSVVNAASFSPPIDSYAWFTIKGSHLSTARPRVWQGSDFVNGLLPTNLDGISVTVNREKAAVYYTSAGQINALAPSGLGAGNATVQVTTPAGSSAPFTAQLADLSPAFFTFGPPNNRYIAATLADGTYLAPPGAFGPGANSRPAKPGDTVVLYGTGFGTTNPPIAFGPAAITPEPLADAVRITIGGLPATVGFAGITAAGECQFNVQVPAGLAAGDQPVMATIQGTSTQPGLFVNVQP